MYRKVKVLIVNAKKLKSGEYIAKWFELPISQQKIYEVLKIETGNFHEECLIMAYEAPFKINEELSLKRINYYADKLLNLPVFILKNWEQLRQGGDEFLFAVLEKNGSCFSLVENTYADSLSDLFSDKKTGSECKYAGVTYYLIDGVCIKFDPKRLSY